MSCYIYSQYVVSETNLLLLITTSAFEKTHIILKVILYENE